MKKPGITTVITGVVVATVVSALVLIFAPEAQAGSSSVSSGTQSAATISMVVNTFEDAGGIEDTQTGAIIINDTAKRRVTVVGYWVDKNFTEEGQSLTTILSPKKTFTY